MIFNKKKILCLYGIVIVWTFNLIETFTNASGTQCMRCFFFSFVVVFCISKMEVKWSICLFHWLLSINWVEMNCGTHIQFMWVICSLANSFRLIVNGGIYYVCNLINCSRKISRSFDLKTFSWTRFCFYSFHFVCFLLHVCTHCERIMKFDL